MSNVYAFRDRADTGPTYSRPVGARLAKPVLICLTLACGLFLLARYAALPLLTIRHVILQSDVAISEDQLLAIAGLQGTAYWHSLSAERIRGRLEAYPLVRHARVEKVFPDTVRITIWGRQPVALVLASAEGRSIPVLVDEQGVVFKVGSTSAELDLPVISGLPPADLTLGAQLPALYAPLFAQLASLQQKSPSLAEQISEVRIVPRTEARYDLRIYLTSSPVPILAGGTIDENLLKYSLMVLDLLSKQGLLKNIQELDFRGGDAVYRMKGG